MVKARLSKGERTCSFAALVRRLVLVWKKKKKLKNFRNFYFYFILYGENQESMTKLRVYFRCNLLSSLAQHEHTAARSRSPIDMILPPQSRRQQHSTQTHIRKYLINAKVIRNIACGSLATTSIQYSRLNKTSYTTCKIFNFERKIKRRERLRCTSDEEENNKGRQNCIGK